MGAQKGDVMAILMPNKVEYVLAMFGASAVGVVREICTKINNNDIFIVGRIQSDTSHCSLGSVDIKSKLSF